jgi:hypothetical protein
LSQSVSQSSQPPRTIEQKGLESRGTSALAQAIGTGAPVPVDAAQRDAEITPSGFIVPPSKYIRDVPQQQPTPPAMVQGDGPWIIEQVGDECLLHNPTLPVGEVRTFKVSRNGITWLRDILNKQHAENERLRLLLEILLRFSSPDDSEGAAITLLRLLDEAGFHDREDKNEGPSDFARRITREALAKAGGR